MRLAAFGLALFGLGLAAGQDEQALEMGTLKSAFVNEDSFQYYSVTIPQKSKAVKIKLIPSYGDPDAYLSFTSPEPDDLTATWVMDDVGAEEQVIKRDAIEFCQYEPCVLHISVYGYDESEYMIGVYDATPEGEIPNECAPGCKQDNIADGVCQQECKVAACFDDGGDCEEQNCAPGCDEGWVGDEYCDEACFVEACNWDGGDCSENSGCNTGCLPEYINDGECDAECNVAACGWDGDDCFHRATECYAEPDGKDYRGMVNKTKSGKECQAWDAQFPQQHTRTHLNYPDGGLGGHNHCRNPDGEATPWCYTTDSEVRFEPCEVGQPWQHCKQNEIPLATQQAGAVICLNPTTPPSGPLPRFEQACGNGESHADVCSRTCCNAAKAAAAYCANDETYTGRHQDYKMKIAFSMLKQDCTTCEAFADFNSNVNILGPNNKNMLRFVDSFGFKILILAFLVMLIMLCVIAGSIARYVWQRRQYAMPESAA
jgi:hypothetical protein